MKLKILGAAGEVTGSNYMIETKAFKVLVDCGFYQGKDEQKHEDDVFPFNPADIDAVLLTHAHIDHSGRIPFLVRQGFKGKVYCTFATSEMVDILWHDSARLQMEEAAWRTKKNMRKGLPKVEPLYDERDVEAAIKHKAPVSYDEIEELLPGLKVRFREAGHILGSAIIETWVSEEGADKTVKVVFSGDLGPKDGALEKPPAIIEDGDFVLIESTYGDRLHKTPEDTRAEFQQAMTDAIREGSKVLVPTFVVDRAQRILYELSLLQKKMPDKKMPPIFLDSPMGVKTTEIYSKYTNLLSKDLKDMFMRGEDPFAPDGFSFVRTSDESKAINDIDSAIVLAGSGMVTGGRIVHHLKHNLHKPNTHVFFVGYQAQGTLGRRLVDGAKEVRIAGEDVLVRAKLHTLNGFSAHADRDDLLYWASHFPAKARFVVVHGEPKSAEALALSLKEKGHMAHVPAIGEEIDLLALGQQAVLQPLVSPRLQERAAAVSEDDMQLTLDAILSKAGDMKKMRLDTSEFAKIVPLLISARTLLEAADAVNQKKIPKES
ncbi:MBL fold metallo-hydrolase [Synergistaceae bacterium OttesenSCG-928-D05]|nr:MBL fold metallo-hydrolase [Synergistaceae bacterium OttesenSCG-928-D05]